MRKIILLALVILNFNQSFSQSVYPIATGITVDSVLAAKPNATKIARDPVSGHLFYTTVNGDIYEVFIPGGAATDSLRFTAADHGITYLQGLYFRDSVMYVCSVLNRQTMVHAPTM